MDSTILQPFPPQLRSTPLLTQALGVSLLLPLLPLRALCPDPPLCWATTPPLEHGAPPSLFPPVGLGDRETDRDRGRVSFQ